MKNLGFIGWISFILVIIGGLNWGLVGFFHFNLVNTIFGAGSLIARIIYAVVGLAAVWLLFTSFKSKA